MSALSRPSSVAAQCINSACVCRRAQKADPIKFLADVMDGQRMVAAGEPGDATKTWVFPTLTQRITASETLLRKLLPDLRSVENTGNLQPAFTAIERRIVDPAGEAAAAIRAEVNRRAGNGVAESDASAEPEPAENVRPLFRERNRNDRS